MRDSIGPAAAGHVFGSWWRGRGAAEVRGDHSSEEPRAEQRAGSGAAV